MPFGNKTIVFTRIEKVGAVDELGHQETERVEIPAPHCRHRPLTFREMVELEFDVASQPWKSTIPLFEYSPELVAQLIATGHEEIVQVDGEDYQIVGGVRPYDDIASVPFKMTIISMRQKV